MPTVSVVICTHSFDRLDRVRRAVHSVLEGTRKPDDIFLIVDGNSELSAALDAELAGDVTVLDSDGRGASEARNSALRRANSEVIACLDDDAWADPMWLQDLVAPFEDPDVCGAGGRIVPDWENESRTLPPELWWIVGATYAGHRTDAGPISRPIGANMAGRRVAMMSVGGFSPEFGPKAGAAGSYNEELVMFSAMRERCGAESVRYAPTAVVHHFAPAARTSWKYLWQRSLVEGKSKADARMLYGSSVMSHDRSYVTGTLVPGVGRYALAAVCRLDPVAARFAATTTAAFAITAASYARRIAAQRFSRLMST